MCIRDRDLIVLDFDCTSSESVKLSILEMFSLYIHKELNVGILGDNSLSVLSCMKEVLKDTPVNLLFE